MIQPFAAIVLVMGLLGGALLLLKRRGMASFQMPRLQSRLQGAPRKLEVLERVSLGPHHALHLVRAGERCILIATGQTSCQVVLPGQLLDKEGTL
jgi:flagellar biogenesis protein FliO